ncbi:hypothetical protein V5O48_008900 [Marasmius crinis-equi]|uniref:Uncharacterized protein n=1 Tax=Marasmius crinis-equi TaxID=585013 RepID=A0ABR3FD88_9AGAR
MTARMTECLLKTLNWGEQWSDLDCIKEIGVQGSDESMPNFKWAYLKGIASPANSSAISGTFAHEAEKQCNGAPFHLKILHRARAIKDDLSLTPIMIAMESKAQQASHDSVPPASDPPPQYLPSPQLSTHPSSSSANGPVHLQPPPHVMERQAQSMQQFSPPEPQFPPQQQYQSQPGLQPQPQHQKSANQIGEEYRAASRIQSKSVTAAGSF